jgi:hypothetical protein
MSRHYSEDDLTLYYYGEGRRRADIDGHIESCPECAARYRDLAGTLALIGAPDTPERDEQYGREVWQRIRHRLPEQHRFGWFTGFNRLIGFAAAAAALVIIAFIAGQRFRPNPTNPMDAVNHVNPVNEMSANDATAKRILLTSVADHLDRSERVLTDIMNTSKPGDISVEQSWAEDLIDASRLYRQDAVAAGEPSVALVLDEIERNLLEIVHSPSRISNDDLEQIRRRIDAAALLFKVRVLGDELRRRNKTS